MKSNKLIRHILTLSLLGVTLQVLAQAVPPSPPPPSTNSGEPVGQSEEPENTRPSRDGGAVAAVDDDTAPMPALIDGQITTLQFGSELGRTNYLNGGVSVGATYDDNVLSSTTAPEGGYAVSVLPYIALDQSRARLHWNFNYAAGFVANQRLSQQNQSSHNLGAALEYRLSPHVELALRDHFVYTSNFFDVLQGGLDTSGSGILQQPNQSVITPLAKQISNLSTAQLNYQFARNDLVGASGTFYISRFRDVPAGTLNLIDTDTQEGEAYYTHRLARSYWIGAAYEFQNLTFSPGVEQAQTHSFLLFNTIYLRPRMSITLFGGPQFYDLDSQIVTQVITVPAVVVVTTPVSRHDRTITAGGNFNWQGERTSAQLGAARKVTDGGGIFGAVESVTVNAAVRQKLGKTTALALGVIAGDNRALADFTNGSDRLRSASGSASLEQRLGPSFMLNLGYARDYQRQSGGAPLPTDANHNRGWISFTYNFSKAIGR